MRFPVYLVVLVPLMISSLLLQGREKYAANDGKENGGHTAANEPASLLFPTGFMPQLDCLLADTLPVKTILGYTRGRRPVDLYYFPGKKALQKILIIGGVHGSELSSIALAETLATMFGRQDSLQYQVVLVPNLFPDNAAEAQKQASAIGSPQNIGRYTHASAPDPNRQMPAIAKPFSPQLPLDARGRRIERENQWLLHLIQQYQPHLILSLHACHHTPMAGVYADPRTDCQQLALGYQTDHNLAKSLAGCIQKQGGHTPGNSAQNKAQTRYPLDPPVAAAGKPQVRNLKGSVLPNGRGEGISLGTWASTSVCDTLTGYGRNAISILTLEFPGCKRPQDYELPADKKKMAAEIKAWARGITLFVNMPPPAHGWFEPSMPVPETALPADSIKVPSAIAQ